MKYFLLTAFLLINLVPGLAAGKGLDYYLRLLDDHPKVQAVLEQHRALINQAEGAAGLPDPSLTVGVENVPISDPTFDRFLPSAKTIGISQDFPNNKSRKAQKGIYLSTADSTVLLAGYTKSRLHAQFFTRLGDLERVNLQTRNEEEKKQIISQLQDYYEGQIVAGEPIYQKTFLTEIELTEIEQNLNTLHAEEATIEADLIQLVGEIPEIDDLRFTEKKWNGEPVELYPVQLARKNIAVEKARVDLADSRYSPSFGMAATYKFRVDGENDSFEGDDWFSLQFRMTIPLWASKNQHPKLEAAASGLKSARYLYDEAVRTWQAETSRLLSAKHASALNIEVLQKKDIALEMKIGAMERTYSAGQTSLEPVLQAEIARLSLLSQIAAEKSEYIRIVEELNSHIPGTEIHESY